MIKLKYPDELKKGQRPEKVVITCSDSRIPSDFESEVFRPGKVFVIRTIGNSVVPVLGSVLYPILHLNVKEVWIVGHSDCGAIKACLNWKEEENEHIKKELLYIKAFIEGAKDLKEAIIKNVLKQREFLLNIKEIKEKVERGELKIRCFYFDFEGEETKLIEL